MGRYGIVGSVFALGLAQIANAEPKQQHMNVVISDLDLSVKTGQVELDSRLQRAARQVCGVKIAGDGVGNEAIEQCRVAAIAQARSDATRLAASRPAVDRIAVRAR